MAMTAAMATANMTPTRPQTTVSLDLPRRRDGGAGGTSGSSKRSRAGVTVIDDPTEIFEGLGLPLSCSGTCASASALAASDTCPSQTARAPVDDPTETFEGLGLPLSCSDTCLAASALAASDTCLSQTA